MVGKDQFVAYVSMFLTFLALHIEDDQLVVGNDQFVAYVSIFLTFLALHIESIIFYSQGFLATRCKSSLVCASETLICKSIT